MRSIMILMLAVSVMFANGILEIKKGWQLIGVPSSIDVDTSFNSENVEILWVFDAPSQEWSGYSPDENLSTQIEAKYKRVDTLEPYQAMWILSREDWSLEYTQATSTTVAKNSTIVLKEGWNLIAIPQQIVVSDDFFGDALVWRYSEDQEWSVNDGSLNFPSLDAIKQSEGLWVKSKTSVEINIDKEGSKLRTFDSRDEMLSYIRKMIEMNQYYYGFYDDVVLMESDGDVSSQMPTSVDSTNSELSGSDPSSDSSSTPESATDATTTNLQEEGVDEGDIVKHDGIYIFSVDSANYKIVVTSFEAIAKQEYTPITSIDFSGKSVVSMYLQNSRLSVVSNTQKYYLYDDIATSSEVASTGVSIMPYGDNHLTLDIYDVSDIQNIKSIASHIVSGRYQDSRLINGELYLISQYSPQVEYEYPKIYVETPCSSINQENIYASCSGSTGSSDLIEVSSTSEVISVEAMSILPDEGGVEPYPYEEKCEYGADYKLWNDNQCYQYNYDEKGAWKYDYENPIIVSENLVPMISSNANEAVELLSPSSFYAPTKLNQSANITTLSRFSIESGEYKLNSSFLGNTHTYYASLTSLYLVSSEYPMYYDYINYKEQQMIYKFALDTNLTYEGRGFVEGRMLNQFSMSEKDDYLRVATTSGWSWWSGGETTNSVYTLKKEDESLNIEGTLSGLGKEGETIRAVRFMGDRGFVVTFRQTDPLYTLDMSDPKEPKVVGELSIPGFSTYLHVIDENRVLSIGRNADEDGRQRELQFQLFDISDFANPKLADKIQIGDDNSYSEAEHNHKAFSYRASDMMFGVPYQSYSQLDYSRSEHFDMYKVEGLSIVSLHTLTSTGSHWGNVGRGLIFDLNATTYGALLKGSNMICEDVKDAQ